MIWARNRFSTNLLKDHQKYFILTKIIIQLICCSGRDKNGSLRIVRNDMEIKDVGTVELPGILGIWALSLFSSETFDDSLFVTFPDETK